MREPLLKNFLSSTDWAQALQSPLAGDASFRRYIRLSQNDGERAQVGDFQRLQFDAEAIRGNRAARIGKRDCSQTNRRARKTPLPAVR